jgi:hypothetical protein
MATSDADSQLYAIMTRTAHQVLASSDPYWVGIDGMDEIAADEVMFDAEHGGAAYLLWANLTDINDDPRIVGDRALCEERLRMAAAEWLELDLARSEVIECYFRRWHDPLEPVDARVRQPGASCTMRDGLAH